MDARATVEAYYEALRAGEPLGPFFAGDRADEVEVVKFGISERLVGVEAIREGLAEQTRTTTDWTVDSRDLRVAQREGCAWFSDDVFLAWTAPERSVRFEFDTRWSGTLERRPGDSPAGGGPATDMPWRFVGMHVSTADRL